jgi:hypothetical protein
MSLTLLYSSNAFFRATLKTLVFGLSSCAAVFCASAGYGLLKMLLPAFRGDVTIGIAEFSTHGGSIILCFVFAVIGAYIAKKCFW